MGAKEIKPIKSDALFKKIMTDLVAAREFLEYYLPKDFKSLIDLSHIKVERESYVENDLKRSLSDIVYSIKTNNNEKAYVYVLVEAQSKVDYWIALRLWKYMLLLCERHKKGKDKLPLVCPMLFYNGKEQYKAPRNLWNLFSDPSQAKKLMSEDYHLVNLQAMGDDEIKQKQHLGMMEYFMKHIHQRDMVKLWERFLEEFKEAILIDQENGYIYIRNFLWYTDAKVSEERQEELTQILNERLAEQGEENTMRTIAQKYADEGFELGLEKGIEKGVEKGIEKGIKKGVERAAINMLKQKLGIRLVAQYTGLSLPHVTKLNKNLSLDNNSEF